MITYELTKRLPIVANKLTLQFDREVEAFEIYNNLSYAADSSYIYPIHSGEYLVWLLQDGEDIKKLITPFQESYLEMTIEIPRGVENRIQWKEMDGSPIKKTIYSGATELPINFSQVVEAKEIVDWLKIAGRDAEVNEDKTLFVWKDPEGKASEITAEYIEETDGIVAIVPDDSVVTTVQWTATEPIPIEQMYHQVLHAPFFPRTAWKAVVNDHGATLDSAMEGILQSIGAIEPKVAEMEKIIPDHEIRISNLELATGTGDTYLDMLQRMERAENNIVIIDDKVKDLVGDVQIVNAGINDLSDKIGDLHNLKTLHKNTLVDAINDAAKTGSGGGGGSITLDPTLIADSLNGVENKGLTEIIGLEELNIPATTDGVPIEITKANAPLRGFPTKDMTIKSALNELGKNNLYAEFVSDIIDPTQEIASNMIIIDGALSLTSKNPVQNKVITEYLNTLSGGVDLSNLVKNVTVDGTSVVDGGIAKIKKASTTELGVIKTDEELDYTIDMSDGYAKLGTTTETNDTVPTSKAVVTELAKMCRFWSGKQSEYDAITDKDPNTIYAIRPD